ncbi:histidinol-phosphatase [Clostridium oceanicum]|uniref:Histidinol-phosphatase n=2 Tax=Clostridium oceanicum TaxID=1543 RepID=A0ABP3URQ9_9CLOT
MMKKTNYHTHHYRCKHAKGEIEEYVKAAKNKGLEEIGISCHAPFKDSRVLGDRMDYSELKTYLKEIDEVNNKYPSIKVLKSLECEYFHQLHDYYDELSKLTDYLILGHHAVIINDDKIVDMFFAETKEELSLYKKEALKALNTGLFKIFAHPDLFMNSYSKWDKHCENIAKEILEACIKNDVIIEYNANGLRVNKNYPNKEFWQYVAKNYKDIPVIVNSDAHDPEYIYDDFVIEAIKQAKDLGLNLKDSISF